MKPLILVWLLACGADATTTTIGLHRGGYELILPTQSSVEVDVLVAAQAAGFAGALQMLNHRGHPKLARWLGWTVTSIRVAAVAYNVHQLAK